MRHILFLGLLTLLPGWCLADTYYISPSGNDANDGLSPASAWLTFANVNQYVADTIFQVGDQVLLERGHAYRGQIDFPVRLDSVTGNFFTFGAFGTGDKPIIMGSESLSGWTPYSGNIWYATSVRPVTQVFVDQKRMTLARYPNTGFLTNDGYGGNTGITDSDLTEPAGFWVGATARIRSADYVFEQAEVFTHTAGGNLGISSLSFQTRPGQGYFLDNKLELLDVETEWYYDAGTQRVYFYAPGGVDPNTLAIEGSVYDYGIKGAYDLRTMTIEDLCFKFQRKDGIWLQGVDALRNTIRNCEFVGQGMIGLNVMGREIRVENNSLDDIPGQGIAGFQLTDSRITGNSVNRIGLEPGFGISGVGGMIGIKVLQSDSMLISQNQVDSTGYAAIEAKTARSVVERNYLTYSMLKLSDGGALECFGPDVFDNLFRRNVIEFVEGNADGLPPENDLIINAIYLDNDVSYITVDSNVIRINDHGGILLNSGTHHCTLRHNIVFGGSHQLVIAEWREPDSTRNHEIYRNVFYGQDAFSKSVRLVSAFGTEDNFASMDSNYYANPYSEFSLEKGELTGNTPVYTLDQWRTLAPLMNPESKDSYHHFPSYQVNQVLSGNLLTNGTFTSNNSGWFCDPHQFSGSNAECSWLSSGGLDGGCFKYEMLANSPKTTGAITSPDLSGGLETGKVYQLSFSAISSQDGNVRVIPRKNGGNYAFLGPGMAFNYGASRREMTAFYPSATIDPAVRLEWLISYDHDKEVIIDNVEWKEVDVTPIDHSTQSVLFTNPTNSPVNIPLSQPYLDLDSLPVTGSITLPPFYGRVLIVDPSGSILYSDLLHFQASPSDDQSALVSWQLDPASELAYMVLEKSANGRDFFPEAEVSFEPGRQAYSYLDIQPLPGAARSGSAYYRLKLLSPDGLASHSSVEQVRFSESGSFLSVFPNPATETLFVSHSLGEGFILELLDPTGRQVFSGHIKGNGSILVEHLPKGIYLARAWEEDQILPFTMVTEKIVLR